MKRVIKAATERIYTYKICDGESATQRSSEIKDEFWNEDYVLSSDADAVKLAIYMAHEHESNLSAEDIEYATQDYLADIGEDRDRSLESLVDLACDVDLGAGGLFVDSLYQGDREIFDQGLEGLFEDEWVENHSGYYDDEE